MQRQRARARDRARWHAHCLYTIKICVAVAVDVFSVGVAAVAVDVATVGASCCRAQDLRQLPCGRRNSTECKADNALSYAQQHQQQQRKREREQRQQFTCHNRAHPKECDNVRVIHSHRQPDDDDNIYRSTTVANRNSPCIELLLLLSLRLRSKPFCSGKRISSQYIKIYIQIYIRQTHRLNIQGKRINLYIGLCNHIVAYGLQTFRRLGR